ncbi:MAG: MBL fold metallo-hydrolase [candidate division KSB1 bacterium]|nr:MBL fold metallo-hydrolase [candidate division KSB1 bacterium]
MQAKICYDNTALPGFHAGWGFSCLVDQILFDTGEKAAPLFSNMEKLNIDRSKIESVVISHTHWDHTGGLWELLDEHPGLNVYGCPGFSDEFKNRVEQHKGIFKASEPGQTIAKNIQITGEIASIYKGVSMPEQALIIPGDTGISVITGCSHPGILNILRRALAVTRASRISLVFGGFHMMNDSEKEIDHVIDQFQALPVERVGATHCTGNQAIAMFQKRYGDQFIKLGSGRALEI